MIPKRRRSRLMVERPKTTGAQLMEELASKAGSIWRRSLRILGLAAIVPVAAVNVIDVPIKVSRLDESPDD